MFPFFLVCDAATTCDGRGYCNQAGQCVCTDSSFVAGPGANCKACVDNLYPADNCTICM